MSETKTAVTEEDAYAIAYALGQPFPAPHGASIVSVTIFDRELDDGGAVFEGIYMSKEDALIEVARWIIIQEGERDARPWEYDKAFSEKYAGEEDGELLARAWYGSLTPAEIVQGYFKDNGPLGCETLYMIPTVITKVDPWKGGAETDW